MTSPKQLAIVIVVGFLCATRACFGIPHLSIPRLVSESTLIVVAEVGEIKPVAAAQVVFNGSVLKGQSYRAEAVVLYTLTGDSPGRFTIEFALPNSSNGYRSVRAGIRMLFLKKSGDGYTPVDLFYPDLPALRSPLAELQGKTVTERVFGELGAVVASADASTTDRRDVLFWSYAIPDSNKSFLKDVLAGVQNTADPDLHWRLEAELIRRNDASQFADVCNALLSGSVPPDEQREVLYAIASRLNNEKALPELRKLLQSSSPEIRVASAQALWHTASPASVGALAEALHDENPDVRYYAIRGLADATEQPQWGPSIAEYQGHEAKYLSYWSDWATANLSRNAAP